MNRIGLASRTSAGPVAGSTYAFPGSESDLQSRGLIRARYLDPYKARIVLHMLVTVGADNAEIRRTFADLGGYDDPTTGPMARADRIAPAEASNARA